MGGRTMKLFFKSLIILFTMTSYACSQGMQEESYLKKDTSYYKFLKETQDHFKQNMAQIEIQGRALTNDELEEVDYLRNSLTHLSNLIRIYEERYPSE